MTSATIAHDGSDFTGENYTAPGAPVSFLPTRDEWVRTRLDLLQAQNEIERLRAALTERESWVAQALGEITLQAATIAELNNRNAVDAARLREWTDTDIYLAESYVNDLDADIPPMPDRVAAIVNELMEARATIAQQAEQQELDESEAAGIERRACSTHGISWYTNTWHTCPVCDMSKELQAARADVDDLNGQLARMVRESEERDLYKPDRHYGDE